MAAPASHRMKTADEPLRRCLATGESLPKAMLVRFAVAPDAAVVADVAGRLPGRGLWVAASRAAVEQAVKTRAFARAAKRAVVVPDALADDVERLLAGRAVDLLGLARSARQAIAGYVAVERWLRAGSGAMLVEAAEGGAGGRARLGALAGARVLPRVLTAAELGRAFGRDAVAHAAVAPGGLALALGRELSRLSGFRGGAVEDGRGMAADTNDEAK